MTSEYKGVTERVALVTGASRGIGAAVARRLVRDGYGVVLNTLPAPPLQEAAEKVAAEIRADGGEAVVCPADISDSFGVDELFRLGERQLGRVSALVLNAAATARINWTEISVAEWDRVASVNLRGAFLCSRRAFGEGYPWNDGALVTLSSVLALTGARRSVHYATTKAGIIGFTRSLARELGPRGIRVNCVVPGAIKTEAEAELLQRFPEDDPDGNLLRRQALPRRGCAEDIAGAVRFLVSSDSAFITGETICVDGGWLLS